MTHASTRSLAGRTVLVPGGTGVVGDGVVRAYLAAGADVVVPTRSAARSEEFRARLGEAADEHLHVVVHDYTSFDGAQDLVARIVGLRGAITDVVAPIGGWWAGGALTTIGEDDWTAAFVGLATAHMAVARAALPVMDAGGAYVIVVGDSAAVPIPGSGLVSMEQAALLMLQRVLDAEADGARRVFAFQLGQVATQQAGVASVTAEQVGAVAVAASASVAPGRLLQLHGASEVTAALAALSTGATGID